MKCLLCKKRNIQKRYNSKYCRPCALERRKRPIGRLTPTQIKRVTELAGTMKRDDVAKTAGVNRTTFNRWARDSDINFNWLAYKPAVIKDVCEYYAEHGKIKTQKKYPNVKVRPIVERYLKDLDLPPRQIQWTDEQLMELVKMAGIISMSSQAKYFNRPNAHRGSIQSVWIKKFNRAGGSINGLSYSVAKHFVCFYCPVLSTKFWVTRKGSTESCRQLVLWVDVEKHVKKDLPKHILSGISALAKFQRYIHGRNVRANIIKMIKDRQ